MKASTVSILVTILLAVAVAVSDYFLKNASTSSSPFLNRNFLIGLLITTAVTFGWVFVMPHLKLAYIGVIYSLRSFSPFASSGRSSSTRTSSPRNGLE